MAEWEWNGARWWKVDFHAHTPASCDYGKGPEQVVLKKRAPEEWLLDYMRAGVDCVAVTDHNTGAWIDELKRTLASLESEKPEGYRKLFLFPGVEITVHGGIHVLTILGPEKGTGDIDGLLGAIGFNGTKGSSDSVSPKAFGDVVAAIVSAGGIAIPAHVDDTDGLFSLLGNTLSQVLDRNDVFAMELLNAASKKPQIYIDKKLRWTEVLGSDSHHPYGTPGQKFPGSRFTWVKMGQPSIEGLRLALLDGSLSVLRSDETTENPNIHGRTVLQSVKVKHARYMGRPSEFELRLNPWMNAIIGGRGTGKSSLVEFLRLALRRENELPPALRREFEKYWQVYQDRADGGLLTGQTVISAVYRKDETAYRIQWDPDDAGDPIQELTDQGWRTVEGNVQQRFPVRMYSQKQVYQMADAPLALLGIIDDAQGVEHKSWETRLKAEENKYLSLRLKIREIEAGLAEEGRLKGELDDTKRQLALFEKSGHAETLKALQLRRRQTQAVEAWEAGLGEARERLRKMGEEIMPEDLDETSFDENRPEDANLLELVRHTMQCMGEIATHVKSLADKADSVFVRWREAYSNSAWVKATHKALDDYEALQESLKGEGVADTSAYGILVQRHQALENQIKGLEGRRRQIGELEDQAAASLDRVASLRREITKKRRAFLKETLKGNPFVRISVVPYGAKETVERDFRELIQRETPVFDKDIGSTGGSGLLGSIYSDPEDASTIEGNLKILKQEIKAIALNPETAEVGDKRFASHLADLLRKSPEAFDRLDLWFPEDSLEVEYSTSAKERDFRPIQEGSPGQKTAALLAFLLSYGEEPLILDQPEDDLDNHLIYGLIVRQLREIKSRRQVIVVTHNANIVVNGDAEYVVALTAGGGQTQVEADGCLQDKEVRKTICEVMEGGEEAFKQRYRRIALEGRHV